MSHEEQLRKALASYGLKLVSDNSSYMPSFSVVYPSGHKLTVIRTPDVVIMASGHLPWSRYNIVLSDPDGKIILTEDNKASMAFQTAKEVKLAILKTLKATK